MENADAPMVQMTGPHPSRIWRGGRPLPIWEVAVVVAGRVAVGTVYRTFSYRRAVCLSCDMARDRRLFLHLEALPA